MGNLLKDYALRVIILRRLAFSVFNLVFWSNSISKFSSSIKTAYFRSANFALVSELYHNILAIITINFLTCYVPIIAK